MTARSPSHTSSKAGTVSLWINRNQARLLPPLACICAALFGIGLDQIFLRHVGHDQSWCIYAANQVLHGVQLDGPTLIESNPPFIVWFSCLSVLLGQFLHIGILNGFRLFFDILATISIAWSTSLFKRMKGSLFSVLGFAFLQIAVAFLLIRKDSLGQREHMLVLLMVPYLVLAGSRLERKPLSMSMFESILIGIAAAVSVALKPQHIVDVVLIEALLMIRFRSIRTGATPTVAAFTLGIIAYLGAVLAFGRAWLSNILPLLNLGYWGLNHPYLTILRESRPILAGLLLSAAVILFFRRRMRFPGVIAALALAAAGSFIAYIQQHKGWSYQLIPAGLFVFLCLGIAALGLIEYWLDSSAESRTYRPVARASLAAGLTIIAALSCFAGWRFGHRFDYFTQKKRELARFYSSCPPRSAVAYVSTEPWDMPLVLEQHKILGQRANHLWLLPAAILAEDPDGNELHHTMSAVEIKQLTSFQRTSMAEDLSRWKPVMVVVDQCGPDLCPSLHREHYSTLLSWFLADPGFRREWQHYASSDKEGDLAVFRRVR